VYVVTVWFEVLPGFVEAFRREISANAQISLLHEDGCRQFDVCADPLAPNAVFLYEVYDSRVAFDVHLASAHFRRFNELTAPWVVSKKVSTFERLWPL
jgi:autoinducer 2-degrading protein